MKQVIVVRADIKLSRGKLAAQCSHASYASAKKTKNSIRDVWEKEGQKKVILKAKDLSELIRLKEKCEKLRLPFSLISDAGLTEVKEGTITCLGIGPDDDKKINKVTGSLPLLK